MHTLHTVTAWTSTCFCFCNRKLQNLEIPAVECRIYHNRKWVAFFTGKKHAIFGCESYFRLFCLTYLQAKVLLNIKIVITPSQSQIEQPCLEAYTFSMVLSHKAEVFGCLLMLHWSVGTVFYKGSAGTPYYSIMELETGKIVVNLKLLAPSKHCILLVLVDV